MAVGLRVGEGVAVLVDIGVGDGVAVGVSVGSGVGDDAAVGVPVGTGMEGATAVVREGVDIGIGDGVTAGKLVGVRGAVGDVMTTAIVGLGPVAEDRKARYPKKSTITTKPVITTSARIHRLMSGAFGVGSALPRQTLSALDAGTIKL